MVRESNFTGNLMVNDLREESSRREKVIRETLQPVLSEDHLQLAISLCEKEFPPDEPFSTSVFCQRLVETIPGIHLTQETRLMLLRTLRRSASEQKVNRYTQAIEIPAALRQEPVEKPASANAPSKQDAMDVMRNELGRREADSNGQPKRQEASTVARGPGQRSRERRQYPRKPVLLSGHYWAELDDTPTGDIEIMDLSLGGACFRTLSPHQLKNRESLPLEFKLDDEHATIILQNVEVRWVQGDRVGVSWLDKKMMNGPLRTYLAVC